MSPERQKATEIEMAWTLYHWRGKRCGNIPMNAALRERLSEAQNWRCCYCGVRMMGSGDDDDTPTFEHVIPTSLGGEDVLDNLAIACRRCNIIRDSQWWQVHEDALPAGLRSDDPTGGQHAA